LLSATADEIVALCPEPGNVPAAPRSSATITTSRSRSRQIPCESTPSPRRGRTRATTAAVIPRSSSPAAAAVVWATRFPRLAPAAAKSSSLRTARCLPAPPSSSSSAPSSEEARGRASWPPVVVELQTSRTIAASSARSRARPRPVSRPESKPAAAAAGPSEAGFPAVAAA
jgi:hypothetical protein